MIISQMIALNLLTGASEVGAIVVVSAAPAQHFVLFTSTSKSATFSSESYQGATFQSVSNATAVIKDTPQPLGFLLTEDGGIILQENDLPIALE